MHQYPTDTIPLSTSEHRRDHTGMPIDAIVAVTEMNLSFGTIFKLVLFIGLAQLLIAGVTVAVVLTIGGSILPRLAP